MNDIDIFKGKSLSQLLEDIHTKTDENRKLVLDLIEDLKELCLNNHGKLDKGDVMIFYPIIKEYLFVLTNSDSNYIKIASIIQKIITAESAATKSQSGYIDFDLILSDEERKQIIQNAKIELSETLDKVAEEIIKPEIKALPKES